MLQVIASCRFCQYRSRAKISVCAVSVTSSVIGSRTVCRRLSGKSGQTPEAKPRPRFESRTWAPSCRVHRRGVEGQTTATSRSLLTRPTSLDMSPSPRVPRVPQKLPVASKRLRFSKRSQFFRLALANLEMFSSLVSQPQARGRSDSTGESDPRRLGQSSRVLQLNRNGLNFSRRSLPPSRQMD